MMNDSNMISLKLSPRDKYLALLSVTSFEELEDRIVREVCSALLAVSEGSLPVRLSSVAERFKIQRAPRFARNVPHGRIEFDAESGKFIIWLCDNGRDIWEHNDDERGSMLFDTDSGPGRARFTYAHEFAHRFMFILQGGAWKRAIELACEALTPVKRADAIRRLNLHEERVCNAIAGKLLIPRAELIRQFLGSFSLHREESLGFAREVYTLACRFQVSRAAILVQLQRAFLKSELCLGENFAFLLLRCTEMTAAGKRSVTKPRIVLAYLPRAIGRKQIRPLFPGLALENLGDECSTMFRSALKSPGVSGGDLSSPIILNCQGGEQLRARLDGHYEARTSVLTNRSGVLAWGKVSCEGSEI